MADLKIYISGPMSGVKDFNFPLFDDVAIQLIKRGYNVENPADKGIIEGWEWEDYLRYDIRQMMDCNAIVQLPNWKKSKGAQFEHLIAERLRFAYFPYKWVWNN